MISKENLKKAYRYGDWKYLKQNDLDGPAYIMRLALDYDFAEAVVKGKVTENKALRQIQELGTSAMLVLVPEVGVVLATLDLLGLSWEAIIEIFKSDNAQDELESWRHHISLVYGNKLENGVYYNKAVKNLNRLINARPKCGFPIPTKNCSKEHSEYILRAKLVRESQAHDFYIINNILDDDEKFQEFYEELYPEIKYMGSKEKSKEETNIEQKSMISQLAAFAFLLPILMSKN